jgi:hypothetical protein
MVLKTNGIKVYIQNSDTLKEKIKKTETYSYIEVGAGRYIHDLGYNIFLHPRYLNISNDYKKSNKSFLEFKKFLDTL